MLCREKESLSIITLEEVRANFSFCKDETVNGLGQLPQPFAGWLTHCDATSDAVGTLYDVRVVCGIELLDQLGHKMRTSNQHVYCCSACTCPEVDQVAGSIPEKYRRHERRLIV